jgi:hypothetical protein
MLVPIISWPDAAQTRANFGNGKIAKRRKARA